LLPAIRLLGVGPVAGFDLAVDFRARGSKMAMNDAQSREMQVN
jgi:hypothetical protein